MRKHLVIINPVSGGKIGLRTWNDVKGIFESEAIETFTQEANYPGHIQELVQDGDLGQYQAILVVGGDGSIHEVVNGLLRRKEKLTAPLGIIPAGTGNSLARELGFPSPEVAARRIVSGKTHPIDVMEVRMQDDIVYAISIVGWGLVTDINRRAERLRWLGGIRYNIATLLQVFFLRPRRAVLSIGKDVKIDDFTFIMCCNTRYTGKGMKIAPRSRLDDGKIDLIVVPKAGRMALLKMFPKVFDGSHVYSPIVEYKKIEGFTLAPSVDEPLNLDGEILGRTPVSVSVLPGAIEIFSEI